MDQNKLHEKVSASAIGKKIKVTQIDGAIVNGVLVSIDADSFQITPEGAVHPIQLMNSSIAKVSSSHGLSTGAKIGIGVLIGIGIVIITIAALLKSSGW